jgi:putative phosphoesterase
MIYLIASDIHGSAYFTHKLIDAYKNNNASRLILLGDILYHGPRNDLPLEYNPKKTYALLNMYGDSILCVKGNCEAEVDQMVLEFPIMADYATVFLEELGGRMIYLTHGHHYNEGNLPPMKKGDILINGHTHIPVAKEENGFVFLNPGSVSIPKGGWPNSYILYKERTFTVLDFEGNTLMDFTIEV